MNSVNEMLKVLHEALGPHGPVLVAGAPPTGAIAAIEDFWGAKLPADYRAFVEKYGGAIVGPYSIFGLGVAEAMGFREEVIPMTLHFRSDSWPGANDSLVVSMDLAGNAITMDADGSVRRFDHDANKNEVLAWNFSDFVSWCLSKNA